MLTTRLLFLLPTCVFVCACVCVCVRCCADPNAAPEVAEMRQKGRFPLIVSGQVMPGRHRRLTSAHGVGMLSTSLHHRAIETRDACVLQAREHFASADNARKEVLKDVRVALELEKRTWQETVTRIRSLTEEE